MVSFHLWLDRELKRSNLTRTQFAKLAGIGYQTLHPWRLEEYDPSLATITKAAHTLARIQNKEFWPILAAAIQTTKIYNEVQNDKER